MTDHTPLTEQQLGEYEAAARAMLGSWGIYEHGNDGSVTNITDEVRRLRNESEQHTENLASADDPTRLRWGLNDVLWGDDDSVTVLMSGPDREPYWLELDPERAAVLREDLAGPPADEPVTAASTRTLTPGEYDAAWHAVEGAAGEEGADPGTVLHAVLDRLGIEWQDAARPAVSAVETGE